MTRSAVIVGCGNIGTNATLSLVRQRVFSRIVLVDPDAFELRNVESQAISTHDVGRAKVEVIADRIRDIRSDIEVVPVVDRVERVPLGLLRASVILSCLDTRIARQYLNESAWRLGVPFVDAGVDGYLQLARVDSFVPGRTRCLECGWSEVDYRALEVVYACRGEEARPTYAPAYLGALAASLQVCEAIKLASNRDAASAGQRVLVCLDDYSHSVTDYRINRACRFDHEAWSIRSLDVASGTTIRDLLNQIGNGGDEQRLRVAGSDFITRHRCLHCDDVVKGVFLSRSVRAQTCAVCGENEPIVTGRDTHDALSFGELGRAWGTRRVSEVGFATHDVVTVGSDGTSTHFELRGVDDA